MIKIGLVQASASRDVFENLRTIERYITEAKDKGCEVICFSEGFLTGYAPEEAEILAVERDCEAVKNISKMVSEAGCDLLVGFMERDEESLYLTHGIFKADGECEYYRKTHLGEKEAIYFSAGNELNVVKLSCGMKIGIALCVETHFPEISRTLSLREAEVIFAPHAVPRAAGSRKELWGKIIPARSYDNRVYMACCNQWDNEKFGGGCIVTNPKGEVIAECFEDREGLLTAEVDLEEVRLYHDENAGKRYRYYPSKVRKELYE